MVDVLDATTSSLLDRVRRDGGRLTSETIRSLYLVYTTSLVAALDLIDRDLIVKSELEEGQGAHTRAVYTVMGSSDVPYTVMPRSGYCSCPAFHMNVVVMRQTVLVGEGGWGDDIIY